MYVSENSLTRYKSAVRFICTVLFGLHDLICNSQISRVVELLVKTVYRVYNDSCVIALL